MEYNHMHGCLAHSLWVGYSPAGRSWKMLGFVPNFGLGLDVLHKSPHSKTNTYPKHVLLMTDCRMKETKHTQHI